MAKQRNEHMERVEKLVMVKAMEYICRQLNDEDILMSWLTDGVADGDVEYGNFDFTDFDNDEAVYYIEDDETFADLMATFLRCVARANESGGLYCGNVVSKEKEW